MSETNTGHTKWLHIRLKEADYKRIRSKFESSVYKKLSEYARRVLLDKPVTIKHRNQSLDDFMAEMMVLRTELNAIGNNYNQLVKKLHTLEHFRDVKMWLMVSESNHQTLLKKVSEIKSKINQINDQWLQL